MSDIDEFIATRREANAAVLAQDHLGIKRFFALDDAAYRDGALPGKVKELLGLASSLVLRCNDCVDYHLVQLRQGRLEHRRDRRRAQRRPGGRRVDRGPAPSSRDHDAGAAQGAARHHHLTPAASRVPTPARRARGINCSRVRLTYVVRGGCGEFRVRASGTVVGRRAAGDGDAAGGVLRGARPHRSPAGGPRLGDRVGCGRGFSRIVVPGHVPCPSAAAPPPQSWRCTSPARPPTPF